MTQLLQNKPFVTYIFKGTAGILVSGNNITLEFFAREERRLDGYCRKCSYCI